MDKEVKDKMKPLHRSYDRRANVLYISVGDPVSAVTVPLRSGVLVRADRKTGEFAGVTVIDLDASRREDYERVLTDYPKVPRDILPEVLAQITELLSNRWKKADHPTR